VKHDASPLALSNSGWTWMSVRCAIRSDRFAAELAAEAMTDGAAATPTRPV